MNQQSEETVHGNGLQRRDCIKRGIGTFAALATAMPLKSIAESGARIPLGLDAHSVRSMRWKASELLTYAAEQNADALLLNGPHYFKSLDRDTLNNLRLTAHSTAANAYTKVAYRPEFNVPDRV